MTRRLLALFAPSLLAAQAPRVTCRGMDCEVKPRIPRPRNGECPVCGTMAQAYIELPDEEDPSRRDRGCFVAHPMGQAKKSLVCLNVDTINVDHSIHVDCAHCNVTFRQWAEGKEPKR